MNYPRNKLWIVFEDEMKSGGLEINLSSPRLCFLFKKFLPTFDYRVCVISVKNHSSEFYCKVNKHLVSTPTIQ
ncbi:hypothetical protein SAMN06265347_110117 [Halobellus salinus]|nr:hypothetical protein SAMN06265347_110117 [Halobellus salinus]